MRFLVFRRYFYLLFFLGFVFSKVFAQTSLPPSYKIIPDWTKEVQILEQRYTQAEGLPVSSVTQLAIGDDGYLYIATLDGIIRFNGYNFDRISFSNFDQITTNRFVFFKKLAPQTFVLGTENEQMFLWNNEIPRQILLSDPSKTIEPTFFARSLGSNKHYFYGSGKVGKFTDEGYLKEIVYSSKASPIVNAYPITDSLLCLVNDDGVNFLKNKKLIKTVPWSKLPMQKGFPVRVVATNEGGIILYGIFGFLYLNESFEIVFSKHFDKTMKDEHVRKVVSLNSTDYEFYTRNFRFLWNKEKGIFNLRESNIFIDYTPNTIQKNWLDKDLELGFRAIKLDGKPIFMSKNPYDVRDAIIDPLNQLWVAVSGYGLIRLSENKFKTLNRKNGLPGENLYSIIENDKNELIAASIDAGPIIITPTKITWWKERLAYQATRSVFIDSKNTLFTGNYISGVWQMNSDSTWAVTGNSATFFNTLDNVAEAIFEDSIGNLWIASRENLFVRKNGEQNFTIINYNDKPLPFIHAFYQPNPQTILLLSGGNGVWAASPDFKIKPLFNNLPSLRNTRDFHKESEQVWWFASETKGLVSVELLPDTLSVKKIVMIDEAHGLPTHGIHRIIEDNYGDWWMSSNLGIIRVSAKSLKEYRISGKKKPYFELFQEKQGLPIREANGGTQSAGLKLKNGNIVFPLQKGLVLINPEKFQNSNTSGPALLKAIELDVSNRRIDLQVEKAPVLSNSERNVVFRFDALFIAATDVPEFEYTLDAPNDWLPLKNQTFITESNLNHGKHSIKVRQVQAGENVQPLIVNFSIEPYFYETNLFKALLIFSILGGMILIGFISQFISRKRQEHLEDEIKKRTFDLGEQKYLTEKALETVKEQAEQLKEIDRYKSNLFMGFAHELRTPLALIQGPLELLQQASTRIDSENSRIQLDIIKRNSGRLKLIIEKLLHLINIENEDITHNQTLINLKSVFEQIVHEYRTSHLFSSKTIELKFDSELGTAIIDQNSLEFILSNFLSNAIKYSYKASTIIVRAYKKSDVLYFSVQSFGDHIPKEEQKKIYDLFYRVPDSSNSEGIGLGLTIVRRLVESMNGSINLTSDVENGTIFIVQLPLIHESNKIDITHLIEPTRKKVSTKIIQESKLIDEGMPKTRFSQNESNFRASVPSLLVVEDNSDFQTLLHSTLTEDFNLYFAKDGLKGLEQFEQQKVDLIISDMMMPNMDGFAFATEVRKKTSGQFIPFIFLTANDQPEALKKGMSIGVDLYLTKPVNLELLKAYIWSLLNRKKSLETTPEEKIEIPEFVQKLNEIIMMNLSSQMLSVDFIASEMNMSRATLYRKWDQYEKGTINEQIVKVRLSEALFLVTHKDCTFSQAALTCGFADIANFSKTFKRVYGVSPSQYVKDSSS